MIGGERAKRRNLGIFGCQGCLGASALQYTTRIVVLVITIIDFSPAKIPTSRGGKGRRREVREVEEVKVE